MITCSESRSERRSRLRDLYQSVMSNRSVFISKSICRRHLREKLSKANKLQGYAEEFEQGLTDAADEASVGEVAVIYAVAAGNYASAAFNSVRVQGLDKTARLLRLAARNYAKAAQYYNGIDETKKVISGLGHPIIMGTFNRGKSILEERSRLYHDQATALYKEHTRRNLKRRAVINFLRDYFRF